MLQRGALNTKPCRRRQRLSLYPIGACPTQKGRYQTQSEFHGINHGYQPFPSFRCLSLSSTALCAMAESIGLASGLLTLTLFALQSSAALYNTIQSFQSHQKRVRDLVEELEALNGVLQPLKDTLQATNSLNLSSLELPLRRCGDSCKEFEQELLKCSSRSTGGRTSFRDWAKLRYMGDDVDGFRRLLAGYKLTICIALTDANLCVFHTAIKATFTLC